MENVNRIQDPGEREKVLKGFIDTGYDGNLKSVIPYRKYPLAPATQEWDAGSEVNEADIEDLKQMCAWYDKEKPDIKVSYKLPHHTLSGYKTVWRAVTAAMGALLGARGGVDIPEKDRKGVYKHLAKHYADFDKEPPEFKNYPHANIGEDNRNAGNFNNLKERLEKLQELIDKKEQRKFELAIEKQIEELEKELDEEKTVLEIEQKIQVIQDGITALETGVLD
jgi:hypothetical protein